MVLADTRSVKPWPMKVLQMNSGSGSIMNGSNLRRILLTEEESIKSASGKENAVVDNYHMMNRFKVLLIEIAKVIHRFGRNEIEELFILYTMIGSTSY